VKTIGVLALQGDVQEHVFALEAIGASAVLVRRERELTSIDGLIIPGGESTTMWKLAKAFDLLAPLREVINSGLPVYGSCAGMIMLAERVLDGVDGQETLGGMNVSVRRNAFGRQINSFETHGTIPALGEPDFPMVFIRAPWVEEVGSGVNVLAAVPGEDGASRIVAIEQGALLATSFHPEVTTDTRLHRYFVEEVCSR
jgi:pyridoxal 5'-phosphate synthase pdxT subunit